jgi:polyhydroxyalkanoate synthesis regulator phasin
VTNRNLLLIKELDIKVEKLKNELVNNGTLDADARKKISEDIISISQEKVWKLFGQILRGNNFIFQIL